MIWNSHSSQLEEPNIDERERAMGFHTGTTIVFGVSKGVHRHILGQVMDLNYLTWIFNLCLAKQTCFAQFSPPNPSHVSIVAPTIRTCMLVQVGGGDPSQLWDLFTCQEKGMGFGKKICDKGAPRPSKGAPHSA
jgi:hypothetical protein